MTGLFGEGHLLAIRGRNLCAFFEAASMSELTQTQMLGESKKRGAVAATRYVSLALLDYPIHPDFEGRDKERLPFSLLLFPYKTEVEGYQK